MNNDIIMHINYREVTFDSYGKNKLEDIVKMAVNIGYDGIEFRGQPPKELSNLSYNEYVDEIARCKQKYGLKTVIMAATLRDVLNKAKTLGADIVIEQYNKAQVRYDAL